MQERLRRIEAYAPFHFYDLGVAALEQKQYAAARDHFLAELRRNAFYHGAHSGLAVAYLGLGETENARAHLLSAQESAASRAEQDLYAAKLAGLQAQSPREKR